MILQNAKKLSCAILVLIAAVGNKASADYFSINKGAFLPYKFSDATFPIGSGFHYKYYNGRLSEYEFGWGYKDQATILGGVNLDSDNKLVNYSLGIVLDSNDIITYREMTMNDKLYYKQVGDFAFGNTSDTWLADIDAKKREVSFRKSGYIFTYGKSTFPAEIFVKPSNSNLDKSFIDIRPEIQYVSIGFAMDSQDPTLRSLVESGKAGWNYFASSEINFGMEYHHLSNQLYSSTYGDTPAGALQVNSYAIRGASGSTPMIFFNFDVGYAYLFKVGTKTASISIAAFYDSRLPPLPTMYSGTTESGEKWQVGIDAYYGIKGGVAFQF